MGNDIPVKERSENMADVTMLREALKPFLSAVALEEMSESVDKLNEAISELENEEDAGTDWKARYDSLKEDYVKRFTEVSGNAPTVDSKPEEKSDEPVDVTIEDLDFDATTE